MGEFLILAALVKVVVDRVRARFLLDGDLVNLAAALVGIALAVLLQVNVATELVGIEVNEVLGMVVTGIGIGLGASFLNDTLKAVATSKSE